MVMTIEKAARITRCSLKPNRPYHVQWLLTRKCNYCCKGCNVWREQNAEELSAEQIKRGLQILRDLDVVEIVFSGGDPLIREDIDEILDYASRYFVTTVYDNGSLATKKIDTVAKADFVAISLDTLNARRNDYSKGVKGAWQRSIDAIETLHNHGIPVSVSPTISKMNINEMEKFTKYFVQKNIPLWYCLYSYDDPVDEKQLFRIGKRNKELEILDSGPMIRLCDSLGQMKKQSSNILVTNKLLSALKTYYLTGQRNWKCRALRNFFVINHLGNVAGCHVRGSVGSIFDLPKAWNSPQFRELRQMYERCTGCTYLCYIFYSLHGSVLGNLQLARERWKNAGLLLKKGNTIPPSLAE